MQSKDIKKYTVLTVLFVLPLVAYLFFARGVHNFANLPTIHSDALLFTELPNLMGGKPISLANKINIITFLGDDVATQKAFAFHLKEKIYDKNKDFQDFQVISIVDENQLDEVKAFIYEINLTSDTKSWYFATLPLDEAQTFIQKLTNNKDSFDASYHSPYAYIIDKNGNLRGREDDKDYGKMYGYNMKSIADLNNKMVDDVKVILAEYRLALKKYKADRQN